MSRKAIRQKTIRLKTNDRTLDRYAHILKPLGYYPVLGFSSEEGESLAARVERVSGD